ACTYCGTETPIKVGTPGVTSEEFIIASVVPAWPWPVPASPKLLTVQVERSVRPSSISTFQVRRQRPLAGRGAELWPAARPSQFFPKRWVANMGAPSPGLGPSQAADPTRKPDRRPEAEDRWIDKIDLASTPFHRRDDADSARGWRCARRGSTDRGPRSR